MSFYYNINSFEIKEISDSLFEEWVVSNNPKYRLYNKLPDKPSIYHYWQNGEWKQYDLNTIKSIKLNQLSTYFENLINNGWTTPYGWKLGITTQDIALLNGNFTLAKEASNLGITDPIFVIDTDGESHEFNLQDLTMLMLQYGQARAALSSQDAAKRKAINNATTLEELNNL